MPVTSCEAQRSPDGTMSLRAFSRPGMPSEAFFGASDITEGALLTQLDVAEARFQYTDAGKRLAMTIPWGNPRDLATLLQLEQR